MATSYTTDPLTNDNGLPLVNVMVHAFNASTDALVETAYTGSAGTAAFTALPDDANYYFIARWGNKTLRWIRDFAITPKEYWQSATAAWDQSATAYIPGRNIGDYASGAAVDNLDIAYCTLKIPHDFRSLISAHAIVVPDATLAAAAWNIFTDYAAEGEAYNTHSSSATDTYNVVDNQIFAIDISSHLTSLAANDFVGVVIQNAEADAGKGFYLLGVRIRYR